MPKGMSDKGKEEDEVPAKKTGNTGKSRQNANQVDKQSPPACYTGAMQDELEFRRAAEAALDKLKRHLIQREEEAEAGFEVEEQSGVLNVVFEDPGGKFVITPNTPVRQIWISALSTSFKLDWDQKIQKFVLPRTGEPLIPLVDRLIGEHVAG
jgi:CyaY protein